MIDRGEQVGRGTQRPPWRGHAPIIPAKVRPGVEADLPQLVDLSVTVAAPTVDWDGALRGDLAATDRDLVVAEVAPALVGYARTAVWAPDLPPELLRGDDAGGPCCLLVGLMVAPRSRRRGIGGGLVRAAQAWAAERDATLWSVTEVDNVASLALHRRCGLVPVTRRFRVPGLDSDGTHVLLRGEGRR